MTIPLALRFRGVDAQADDCALPEHEQDAPSHPKPLTALPVTTVPPGLAVIAVALGVECG